MELPRSVRRFMSAAESAKLDDLMFEHLVMKKKFVKAMETHVKAARKHGETLRVRKLADRGFELEHQFFKTSDKIKKYKNHLIKKYNI